MAAANSGSVGRGKPFDWAKEKDALSERSEAFSGSRVGLASRRCGGVGGAQPGPRVVLAMVDSH